MCTKLDLFTKLYKEERSEKHKILYWRVGLVLFLSEKYPEDGTQCRNM